VHIKEKIQNNNTIETVIKPPLMNNSTLSREALVKSKLYSEEKGSQQASKQESTIGFESDKVSTPTRRGFQSERNVLTARSGGFGSPGVSSHTHSLVNKAGECNVKNSNAEVLTDIQDRRNTSENTSQTPDCLNHVSTDTGSVENSQYYMPSCPGKSLQSSNMFDSTTATTISPNAKGSSPSVGGFGVPGNQTSFDDYYSVPENEVQTSNSKSSSQEGLNNSVVSPNDISPSGQLLIPGNKMQTSTGKFSVPVNNMASPRSPSEQCSSYSAGNSSRNTSLSRGFSFPGTICPPSSSESPFNRHATNDSRLGQRLLSTGGFPFQGSEDQQLRPFDRNGGLRRSQSESSKGNVDINYCDSYHFVNSDGGRFSSWRPNMQRRGSNERLPRRSNLGNI
jgi:hypothetical protein